MELPNKSEAKTPAEPKPKLDAVASTASKVSRPATKRFFDYIFAESPRQLMANVGRDVIVPRLKAGTEEAINSFISGMLWGESSKRFGGTIQGSSLRGGRISYSQPGLSVNRQVGNAIAPARSKSYEDVSFESLKEAENVLAILYELLNTYNRVAVADLYECAGLSADVSDNGFGWTSLDGVRISQTRRGYVLELPRPTLL